MSPRWCHRSQGPAHRLEEIRMLNRWVRTVASTVGRGGHRVGQIIKTLLRPVRTTAALTSAAALDAVRPRSELVAENALLRLQILVLARGGPPRPRLFWEDRLLFVLLPPRTPARGQPRH